MGSEGAADSGAPVKTVKGRANGRTRKKRAVEAAERDRLSREAQSMSAAASDSVPSTLPSKRWDDPEILDPRLEKYVFRRYCKGEAELISLINPSLMTTQDESIFR
jgi:hypothetical protein